MKKFIVLLTVFSAFLIFSIACSKQDKDKYYTAKEKAKEIINLTNERNFDEIRNKSTDFTKNALTDEVINSQVKVYLDSFGSFKEILSQDVTTYKVENKDYVLVTSKVNYDNGEIIFKISFDKDWKMFDYFIK